MSANTSASMQPSSLERLQQSPAADPCSAQPASESRQRICSSSRLSPAKCWLLGVLLLLTIAASWPTGSQAAPRKARGLHLILPHHSHNHNQRHHHQNARSAPREHTKKGSGGSSVPDNRTRLITEKVEGRISCLSMSDKGTRKLEDLNMARNVTRNTKKAVICLTSEFLAKSDDLNLAQAIRKYRFQKLELQHPLEEEVKRVRYDEDTDEFSFVGPLADSSAGVNGIVESLMILKNLFKAITFKNEHWNCYFRHFLDFLDHNVHEAMNVTGEAEVCNPGDAKYNVTGFLPISAALETIRVLTVVEYVYDQLIDALN
ncbi:uncharacterized protein LOC108088565 [Drosophila ficusphila]|uniref:uncharacterized protein LOC108088565 n=1 Tax=Drosophila ficusphila TaxID=30025 RepID=UPI0007E80600|nr:uncharacterized protein LOC108088565 [Drosophila ficusphila]